MNMNAFRYRGSRFSMSQILREAAEELSDSRQLVLAGSYDSDDSPSQCCRRVASR